LFDLENCKTIDLGVRLGLLNKKVSKIECVGSEDRISSIEFSANDREIRLKYLNLNNIDSDNVLEGL